MFKYGMRVTLVWHANRKLLRQVGVVVSSTPLIASVHGVKIAFKQDGSLITEGFGEEARFEMMKAGDD